jgi:hypothetical protein
MSTITRRFSVTAARPRNSISRGSEDVVLGRATEWDGDGIQIELDALPVGNWWAGVATLRPVGAKGDHPLPGAPTLRQFDVVAGKRVPGPGLGVENVTKWIKVGFANDLGGYISVTIDSHPVGNWWDGKLRLFVQKPKKVK